MCGCGGWLLCGRDGSSAQMQVDLVQRGVQGDPAHMLYTAHVVVVVPHIAREVRLHCGGTLGIAKRFNAIHLRLNPYAAGG